MRVAAVTGRRETAMNDDPFWRLGAWTFLLHDHGWWIARHQVVRFEMSWPTWRTFHRAR